MLRFVTPYSFDKKLFESWDYEMKLTEDPEDWVCFLDGDIMFLLSDFGHQIQQYINIYPNTGVFTCYASRAHRKRLVPKGVDMRNPSMLYHHTWAEKLRAKLQGKIKVIHGDTLGHLLCIKKATWMKIRDKVAVELTDKKILGVDVRITRAVSELGMPILLMRGVYVMHFFRMKYGVNQRDILL